MEYKCACGHVYESPGVYDSDWTAKELHCPRCETSGGLKVQPATVVPTNVNCPICDADYIRSISATVEPCLTFEKELEQLLNRYSKENDSNTPDFILAEYLTDCLAAYNKATKLKANWVHG